MIHLILFVLKILAKICMNDQARLCINVPVNDLNSLLHRGPVIQNFVRLTLIKPSICLQKQIHCLFFFSTFFFSF